MGERLVITYTFDDILNDNPYEVSIYQHWSGYTRPAFEVADTINSWIDSFQKSDQFETLDPQDRFNYFVKQLGLGKIIDGAFFEPESKILYESLTNTAVNEITSNIKKSNGLIGINEFSQEYQGFAEFRALIDVYELFKDDYIKPLIDIEQFMSLEILDITTSKDVDILNCSIETLLKDPNLENSSWISGLEFETNLFEDDLYDNSSINKLSLKSILENKTNDFGVNSFKFVNSFDELNINILKDLEKSDSEIAYAVYDEVNHKDNLKTGSVHLYTEKL